MSSTVKYEWYQSDAAVTVTVLLKNAAEKNYSVTIQPNEVQLRADGVEPVVIHLCHAIIVEQSSHKATPSKVEIKLAKLTGHRWQALEKQESAVAGGSGAGPSWPRNDWDKMAKEIEQQEAKAPGSGKPQDVFRQIYAEANDDTKKAMMKSFYESGGTVLNTNWAEVGSKTVGVKPPAACEYKKWD